MTSRTEDEEGEHGDDVQVAVEAEGLHDVETGCACDDGGTAGR